MQALTKLSISQNNIIRTSLRKYPLLDPSVGKGTPGWCEQLGIAGAGRSQTFAEKCVGWLRDSVTGWRYRNCGGKRFRRPYAVRSVGSAQDAVMFGIGGSVKIYYCPTPINLRKSFDGLAGAVEEYIKQDPESDHVFAFFSRNKKLVKLL